MDPDYTFREAEREARRADDIGMPDAYQLAQLSVAVEAASDLFDWLASGGFPPDWEYANRFGCMPSN